MLPDDKVDDDDVDGGVDGEVDDGEVDDDVNDGEVDNDVLIIDFFMRRNWPAFGSWLEFGRQFGVWTDCAEFRPQLHGTVIIRRILDPLVFFILEYEYPFTKKYVFFILEYE